ncbi:MAG: hypothetical protein LRS48_00315 [Desulfurococcales archaeon]|nr:hypothetical protein [Desulfurococcales archaeon]
MGVLDWFLSNAEAALTGEQGGLSVASPEALALSLAAYWVVIGVAGLRGLLLGLPYVAALLALRGLKGSGPILWAVGLSTLTVAVLVALVNPYRPLTGAWLYYLGTVTLRVFEYSLSGLLVLVGLGPHGAQRITARLGRRVHDPLLVFYRSTPQLLADTGEALLAQGLLGKGAHEAVTGVTLESLRRIEYMRASFYVRGGELPGRRTPLPPGLVSGGEPGFRGAAVSIVLVVLSLLPLAQLL